MGEVIVPPLTWVSDIAAVLQNGFTPVFVDINRRTLGMDIAQVLDRLSPNTRAVFITHILGYNAITRQLLDEVVALSDKLSLSVHDLSAEPDLAHLYKTEGKAPALVIAARDDDRVTDYGIRYLGVPSGHEFTTLIQDLILVAGRDSGLSPQVRNYVRSLSKPLHLEVFVTPT